MRRGFAGKIIGNTKGETLGVYFGGNPCAEHENGYEGVSEAALIIKGQKKVAYAEKEDCYKFINNICIDGISYNAILVGDEIDIRHANEDNVVGLITKEHYRITEPNEDGSYTAWCENAIGVLIPVDNVEAFETLKSHIVAGSFELCYCWKRAGKPNPFFRDWGLTLLIEGAESELERFEIIRPE